MMLWHKIDSFPSPCVHFNFNAIVYIFHIVFHLNYFIAGNHFNEIIPYLKSGIIQSHTLLQYCDTFISFYTHCYKLVYIWCFHPTSHSPLLRFNDFFNIYCMAGVLAVNSFDFDFFKKKILSHPCFYEMTVVDEIVLVRRKVFFFNDLKNIILPYPDLQSFNWENYDGAVNAATLVGKLFSAAPFHVSSFLQIMSFDSNLINYSLGWSWRSEKVCLD